MKLVRMIYASRFNDSKFDTNELSRIHEKAMANNKKDEITGALIFGNDYFLQCLEGERNVVNKAFAKIVNDPRHSDITLISFEGIMERDFAEWSMKMVLLTEAKKDLVRRFSFTGEFNPFMMTSKSALKFMIALLR